MPQVVVENLSKTFRVAERQAGLRGAVRGLFQRTYRDVEALAGVSFSIEPGELVGYIGPNGAGKSTTIKILSGILVPSGGHCVVDGLVPWRQRVEYVARIGVVFGQRTQLWWDLPLIESFDLLRDIYRVPDAAYRSMRDRMIGLLRLEDLLDMPVRQLSLGQRMRADLAAALLHKPRLLFLDEPTIGLDAVSKLAVRDFIRDFNRSDGVTVILTTHDMDDIEALCNRVMVIGKGQLLRDTTIDALRRDIGAERRMVVDYDGAMPDGLALPGGVRTISAEDHRLTLAFDPDVVASADLIAHMAGAGELRDVLIENSPIEQVIADLYAAARIE